ncbi:MAG: gliding motility-associated C-terminal domain-containing protein, partial [Spirochaetales bacterium]|nr:gliding motility-associated C-terminal domain-containing protein [Spirochaetales bacterium]
SIDIAARPYYDGAIFEVGFTMQFGTKDTLPPKITYNQRDFYVSPNFDGVQDVVEIDLDIKDERYVREWRMEISNEAGELVRVIANKQERKESLSPKAIAKRLFAPKTGVPVPDIIEWDCRDNNGKMLPDGVYTFKFFAMDDNKNQDEMGTPAATVYIDTKKPDMKVKLENRIFSPGTGGTKDKLIIDLDIIRSQVEEEFIPVFEYQNETLEDVSLPVIKSESLEILSRESIQAQAKSVKEKKSKKKKATVTEKKKAERVDDGRVSEQTWKVEIRNAANKAVKCFNFSEKGQKRLEWDGRDENGNQVPDGVYKIILTSRSLAGNSYEEVINNIVIDTQPKPIEISINRSAFSPNGNSVIKTIDFGLDIPVKDGIESWKIEVLNKDSSVVREFSGEKLPPQTVTWDGKDNDGVYLEEGKYTGRLSVSYVNGNIPTGVTPDFIIDVTPPDGRVTNYIKVFSPNGDGNKDETVIEQTTTVEEEWRGYIYDESGNTVKSYIWKSQAPKKLTWDGKDNSNKLLPDGNYDYQLKAIDLAGNTFESSLYRIKIDTENVPLMLTYGLKAFNSHKKSQDFTVIAKADSEKNTSEWKFGVYNEVGTLIYTSKGSGALPKNLLWDGNNNDGKKVPDGSYSAKLDVVFENGTPSSAKTGLFIIDTVAPQIKIQAVSDVFSPNADSRIDTFEVLQAGSEELSWDEYIYDDAGNVMFHKFYENSKPTPKESWNGKDMNGNLAKNGFYKYVITGRDIAENESTASIERFELKNIYTSAFLTLSEEMMAPKGKSPYDVIEIIPMVGVKEDISAYKVEILNESKEIVRVFQGEKVLPEKFTWDGMKTDGTQAVDGLYTAKMTVVYRFGNMPTVETPVFKVDSTAPEIKLTYEPEYFSPDNDNVDDELNIQIDSDDLTGIKEWKIVVIDPQSGKEFTSFSGKGKPASTIKWNGQNENGEIVESAEDYPVKVYAEDLVGNVLEMNASPIMVDILVIKEADGRLKIKISNIEFKPDSSQMVDSAKNVKVLNMLAKALKKYGSYKITIEGHANKFREKIDENRARALSDQRSQAIAAKLKKLGINGGRMTTVGRGVDVPLVPFGPEATKEQLAKNRRVEFYLEK